MKTAHHLAISAILIASASVSAAIPRMAIDTIDIDKKLPASARESIRSIVQERSEMFLYHYGSLLARCPKCRGTVTLELSADSSGTIRSVVVAKVTSRIVDRVFLDALADCIPVLANPAHAAHFKATVKLRFWCNVERGTSSETGLIVMRAIGIGCLLVSMIFSFARLGSM